MEQQEAAAGKLLISDPFLPDPNFARTVVLISAHDEQGSLGFVLNRKTNVLLADVISDFAGIELPLYYGGPVEPNTLHFIHRSALGISGASPLGSGIAWGGELEQITDWLKRGIIKENDIRFFIGYSGWASGQLQAEIDEKSWFVSKASSKHVFSNDTEQLWKTALAAMGSNFAILGNSPQDPRWN